MKYLEEIKCVMLNNLQKYDSAPMGRKRITKWITAFFRFFEKKGEKNSRSPEAIVKGA